MRLYVALAPRSDLLRPTRACHVHLLVRSSWTSCHALSASDHLRRPRTRLAMAKAKNNSPSKTSVREHMGHSHSHAHDSTLLTGNKNDPGVRITRIGLYVNVAMAVSKGLGGYVFNSKASVIPLHFCYPLTTKKPHCRCRPFPDRSHLRHCNTSHSLILSTLPHPAFPSRLRQD